MIWLIVGAIVVVAIAAAVFFRPARGDAGLESFRRHIDALSPEARREVIDRVNRQSNQRAANDRPDEKDGN